MNMLRECFKGSHKLIEIYSNELDSSIEHSVKWCSICGAIVVDVCIDGRTQPGGKIKMKLPQNILNLKETHE